MLLNLFNVIYVLVAVAMIVLILLQRGAGAQAGSGFGSGASATVFGARGAANFLSRSTAILAGLFFVLSLGMGIYLNVNQSGTTRPADDLGVMGNAPDAKPAPAATTGSDVPAPAASDKSASPASDAPPAPAAEKPATAPTPAASAEQ